ncbi:hypothetical protein F2B00_04975 [Streptomyces parvus]|uniref:hypothetical protein n=1 Tax=Streptomyces TaxID=1883 RepID=UPI0012387A9D|nr:MULTISPECIES: hypothetical protein [Streptomyces]KAA6203375.1 hypothetical protein F2B00_04975 [Streptomyces parvus]NUV72038.1 hypothetical protein [Streptomyces sp. CAI-121]NUW16882.1 hypothetical protein [Streptomyces sp. CAI-68]GGS35313.1 hypothetical protein GCM10010221_37340 [Streptomyces parvus]
MTWDEWEQAKARAQQGTAMQLNEVAPERSGSGDGDMVVHDNVLGALGNAAYTLRQHFSTASDHARQNTFDASIQLFNDGLDMGSALTELHDAWNTKAGTLKEACAHISNHLDYSRAQHAKDAVKIATDMRTVGGDELSVSRIHDYYK